jgi:hypothetical protein
MDYGLIGLLFVAVVIAVAAFFARPSKVLPLDELLVRIAGIQDDPKLTAAQKLHLAEIAYRGFQPYWVSLVGGVHDVFPSSSIVMKTSSHDLPLVGIELARVTPEELRAFDKGKAVTLRVRLPGWEKYASVVGLPAAFREARLFYSGRWYNVKSTYRVRDPNEPKTGEHQSLTATGEFRAVKRTGEHAAVPRAMKSGEHPALPKSGPKTGEHPAAPKPEQKTGEFKAFGWNDPKRKP